MNSNEFQIDRAIGSEGLTGNDMTAFLRDRTEDIKVFINSGGGSVPEGIAIFNALKNYKGKVTIEVTGFCLSIASYVAMAGDELIISPNSAFMIHNVFTEVGHSDYILLRKEADVLEKLTKLLAEEYAKRIGISVSEVMDLMNEESWYFGKEIISRGFTTSTTDIDDTTMKRSELKNQALRAFENCKTCKVGEKTPTKEKEIDGKLLAENISLRIKLKEKEIEC